MGGSEQSDSNRPAYVMLTLLASGTLIADPIKRTSGAGKPFATASLRTPTDEDAIIINVIAFDDAVVAALQRLQKGDSLSIAGALLTAYQVKSRRAASKPNGTGSPRHDDRNAQDGAWFRP